MNGIQKKGARYIPRPLRLRKDENYGLIVNTSSLVSEPTLLPLPSLRTTIDLALRFDAPDHRELDSVASWIRAKIWLRSKGLPGNPIIEGVEESNLVDRVHGFVGSPGDGNILTR
jgi:hypothetical protein